MCLYHSFCPLRCSSLNISHLVFPFWNIGTFFCNQYILTICLVSTNYNAKFSSLFVLIILHTVLLIIFLCILCTLINCFPLDIPCFVFSKPMPCFIASLHCTSRLIRLQQHASLLSSNITAHFSITLPCFIFSKAKSYKPLHVDNFLHANIYTSSIWHHSFFFLILASLLSVMLHNNTSCMRISTSLSWHHSFCPYPGITLVYYLIQ